MRTFTFASTLLYTNVPMDLVALGLARTLSGTFFPTDRGRHLIEYTDATRRAAVRDGQGSESRTIIGVPSEPLTYASILAALAGLEEVLFIDPYLGAVDLEKLQEIRTVRRILTGERRVHDRNETGDRRTLLAVTAGRDTRVAVRTSSAIHDRYAIPANGPGLMLGASLGGTKTTVVLELSIDATQEIRERHETIWRQAVPIEPITAPAP